MASLVVQSEGKEMLERGLRRDVVVLGPVLLTISKIDAGVNNESLRVLAVRRRGRHDYKKNKGNNFYTPRKPPATNVHASVQDKVA